jgi:tRNA threonylcarbamoyladenosine biosynthesis protein TsaE
MHITRSPEETFALGVSLGKRLQENSVLCFFGDLGAGKTTLIKGLIFGAAEINPDQVSSPTFVYLNVYRGKKNVYHFDLYRLSDADEFLSMGFEEFFFCGGICCIEWPERIAPLIPDNSIRIVMKHPDTDSEGEFCRNITITGL